MLKVDHIQTERGQLKKTELPQRLQRPTNINLGEVCVKVRSSDSFAMILHVLDIVSAMSFRRIHIVKSHSERSSVTTTHQSIMWSNDV